MVDVKMKKSSLNTFLRFLDSSSSLAPVKFSPSPNVTAMVEAALPVSASALALPIFFLP